MSENHILPDLRIGYKKSRAEVFSMNLLWGGMLLIGILYGAFNGRMQEITDAVLSASREASDTLHDHDGNPCLLAGTDGSCEGCGAYRTAHAGKSGR